LLIVFGGKVTQTGRLNDYTNVIIGAAGRVSYVPSAPLGAGHNPHLTCAGLFDLRETNYDVTVDTHILMQLASVLGGVVQQGDVPKLGVDIDLREEYP
jgi:hypothetical protein